MKRRRAARSPLQRSRGPLRATKTRRTEPQGAGAAAALAATAKDDGRIRWKPVDRGQVKLDEKQPLASAVYQPEKSEKKSNLVLILLGHRWLVLDIKTKKMYQVPPSELTSQGLDFITGELFTSDRLVPTKEWTLRDVGPAELIKLTLNDYGRELQVFLPHPRDIRPYY